MRLPSLRWAGAAAVVILWVTVNLGMHRGGLGFFDHRPISYLGTDHRTKTLFEVGLVGAAALMAGFALFVWRQFRAPLSFLAAFLIGLVGQVVAALIPIAGGGTPHRVHVVGGLVLGGSLPVLMWRFAAGLRAGPQRWVAYGCFWLEVMACVGGVLLSKAMRAPVAEIVPAVGFHLWVGVVTVWTASQVTAQGSRSLSRSFR